MSTKRQREESLIEKIRELPPERIDEIEDFIDFLAYREEDRRLVKAAAKLSEGPLRKVWDNPDDAIFDKL